MGLGGNVFKFQFRDMLNSTGTIKRLSKSKDAGGGSTSSWTAQFLDVPMSVQPVTGGTVEVEGKRRIQADFAAYTDTIYDLLQGDRLTVNGTDYLIVYWEDQAGWGAVFCMYAMKVVD